MSIPQSTYIISLGQSPLNIFLWHCIVTELTIVASIFIKINTPPYTYASVLAAALSFRLAKARFSGHSEPIKLEFIKLNLSTWDYLNILIRRSIATLNYAKWTFTFSSSTTEMRSWKKTLSYIVFANGKKTFYQVMAETFLHWYCSHYSMNFCQGMSPTLRSGHLFSYTWSFNQFSLLFKKFNIAENRFQR